MDKSILIITEVVPHNGIASSVLLYRHLLLFEKGGFKINVISDGNLSQNVKYPSSWNVKILKTRKWWYPPYKMSGVLKSVRYLILFQECKKFIKQINPSIILGFMDGLYYSGFSAYSAKMTNKPFFVFYHDRTEKLRFFNNLKMQEVTRKHNELIIDLSQKVWTVSEQLIYPEAKWKKKFKVVAPIPEELDKLSEWKDNFTKKPILSYAGSLYNECLNTMLDIGAHLRDFGGNLLLMSVQSENTHKIKELYPETEVAPTRDTNLACEYLIDNSSAFLVAYPEDINVMPWIDSCFPSKFSQFTHTGLPIIVIAPRESAIGLWCIKNKWLGYTNDYSSEGINKIISKITSKDSWQKLSEQSILFANTEFNPTLLHSKLEEDIHQLNNNFK